VDLAKIERMRKNLGPQELEEGGDEEEDEEEKWGEEGKKPTLRIQTAPNIPAPKPQATNSKIPNSKTKTAAPKPQATNSKTPSSKTKTPAPRPTINIKDNSPAPEIHRNSNNVKVPDSIIELKKKKQQLQKNRPEQRKPIAPKQSSPRQPIQEEGEEEEGEEEVEVRPAPQKSGRKPQPQGPSKQQSEKKQPQGKPQRPSSKPAPEQDEGANQQSPQTSKHNDKKQKPNHGKPKPPSPGPSKFQNKKAEKLGGPKAAPQPSRGGSNSGEESFSTPRPGPKKQPQISPDISQGGPKDRSDGSRPRKQAGAKPSGSKLRKQGPVAENDDYDYDVHGSELAAKDAVQTAGAPRGGPGPSQNRKINNAPRTNNQATVKKPKPQPGVAKAPTGGSTDQSRAGAGGGGDDDYFKWFRASEQRPADFVARNRDGWKDKYPVPAAEPKAPPPVPVAEPKASPPAPRATGIEKLPSNKRQREKEQQEAAQKAQQEAAQKEQKRRSRREDF